MLYNNNFPKMFWRRNPNVFVTEEPMQNFKTSGNKGAGKRALFKAFC
jgi:hypothetical protein